MSLISGEEGVERTDSLPDAFDLMVVRHVADGRSSQDQRIAMQCER
jgi:hypothetical protein